jgi:hypothetical protein
VRTKHTDIDLTKSLLRKLHERRMHSDQIDHRSFMFYRVASRDSWMTCEAPAPAKLTDFAAA